ncbi:MAG: M48 family metalloprotease [Bacteroidia bacterium]|nr:M48 family metalloprotease [Bacteroidia bacterium]
MNNLFKPFSNISASKLLQIILNIGFLVILLVGVNSLYSQCNNFSEITLSETTNSTGSYYLDQFFYREKKAIESFFKVKANLNFSPNTNYVNAVAINNGYLYGNNGTIVFTKGIINDLKEIELKLACVLAHEFGHILQYKYGWQFKEHKNDELFCDFIAGIYLSNRPFLLHDFPANYSEALELGRESYVGLYTQHRYGDFEFNDPDHHGTPDERVNATAMGFYLSGYCDQYYGRNNSYFPNISQLYKISQNMIEQGCAELERGEEIFTNYSENYTNCTKALFSEIESVFYRKIWVEFDIYEGREYGMRIHVKFNANKLMYKNCDLIAYFYFASGTEIHDYNGNYRTVTGQVSVGHSFKPNYENALYSDFELFIPYSELHIGRGKNDLKFNLIAFKGNKQLGPPSKFYSFYVNY